MYVHVHNALAIIMGIVMAVIGYNYTWQYHMGDEDNLCPNGAAWWLWIFGISNLTIELVKLLLTKCCEGERIVLQVWPLVNYVDI